MIISFSRGFAFIAVPKTASQSIRRALRPSLAPTDWEQCGLFEQKSFPVRPLAAIGHGHVSFLQLEPFLLPGLWSNLFTFAFVRNPYDRFLSACRFLNRGNTCMARDATGTMKRMLEVQPAADLLHLRPQHEFLVREDGTLAIDFVGRFERLQQDFDKVCSTIAAEAPALKRINPSEASASYLDAELRDMVRLFYADDFTHFGYQVSDG